MKKSTIFVTFSLLVLIILFAYFWSFFWNFEPTTNTLSNLGQYLSGTVGLLLTFIFAVIAYITYKHQANYIEKQNFVNVYYKLLDFYKENINSMNIADLYEPLQLKSQNLERLKGRNSIKILYELLEGTFKAKQLLNEKPESKVKSLNELEIIKSTYLEFDTKHQRYVGYYFRNIFNIIFYVHNRPELNDEEKRFYINMLRGQLSSYELLLLFYNCLSERGYKSFKPLIEKYTFLKHIKLVEKDLFKIEHKELYNESAFKNKSDEN